MNQSNRKELWMLELLRCKFLSRILKVFSANLDIWLWLYPRIKSGKIVFWLILFFWLAPSLERRRAQNKQVTLRTKSIVMDRWAQTNWNTLPFFSKLFLKTREFAQKCVCFWKFRSKYSTNSCADEISLSILFIFFRQLLHSIELLIRFILILLIVKNDA